MLEKAETTNTDKTNDDAIVEAIRKATENPELCNAVFEYSGFYFALVEEDVIGISADAGFDPRGGWFPPIITGLTEEEHNFFQQIMEQIGFDEAFFNELTGGSEGLDWEEDYVEEFFENKGEEALKTYKQIRKLYDSGKTPFTSFNELVIKLKRYNLDNGTLYYWWCDCEDYIDLYDNIGEAGESIEEFGIDDEELLDILSNLKDYKVVPAIEDFSEY